MEEAKILQDKYLTVYINSGSPLGRIFSPGVHDKLAPLYTEYPTKETKINPKVKAFLDSFSAGFYTGLWSEAFNGIPPEGAGKTKLYRVMSDAEYQSIINNGGKFSKYDRAMEEKWFAISPEDAAKWAEKFYPDGRYRMIEIEVPTDSLNQMYQVGKLDGIGPAYSGGIDFLNSIMKGLKFR